MSDPGRNAAGLRLRGFRVSRFRSQLEPRGICIRAHDSGLQTLATWATGKAYYKRGRVGGSAES